ncbi:MAG: FecR domain-containing protein [Pirellulales bacterium]
MENISQLISDYLDGELDDRGVERLAAALRSDVDTVDQLVLDSFIHSQLHHWMNVRQRRDEILADAFGGSDMLGCSLGPLSESDAAEKDALELAASEARGAGRRLRRSWIGMFTALATMMLIAATIFTAAYLVAARPTIVAQLTEAQACQWDVASQDLPVGSLLHAGQQLKLASGRALLTFASGAQMMIVGPTTVELDSASKVDLRQGRVGAQVPTQAIGFTVATPSADFVDLGTEFSLTLDETNVCELQVFDGLVELRLFDRGGRVIKERLRISEGSAVRFDAAQHDVASIPYDQQQRLLP